MQGLIRKASGVLACCVLAAAATLSHGQAQAKPAPGTKLAPSQSYGRLLGMVEKEFVDLVEAMPEDKFNFAPPETGGDFKGVRNFGAQVKHVAGSNYYFFGGPDMTQDQVKAKEDSIDKLTSKAEIVQALKDSLAKAHTFVEGITPENAFVVMPNGSTRAGLGTFGLTHMMDHYGQLVVYLRMNGIVPPASRGSM
jgi:uncharacterized damage-inducible protein DinB